MKGILIVYKKTDEWYIEWQRVVQRVTVNDNEWQQMTTSGAKADNEWQRMTQRVFRLIFSFFRLKEEPTTKHPKQNSLNLEEHLEEGLLN